MDASPRLTHRASTRSTDVGASASGTRFLSGRIGGFDGDQRGRAPEPFGACARFTPLTRPKIDRTDRPGAHFFGSPRPPFLLLRPPPRLG